MTIAELLVTTTATLYSRQLVEPLRPDYNFTQCHEHYARQARAIVAAIYGEPCGEMMLRQTRVRPHGAWDMSTFSDTVLGPSATGHPADECAVCKWPRSCHGAKP